MTSIRWAVIEKADYKRVKLLTFDLALSDGFFTATRTLKISPPLIYGGFGRVRRKFPPGLELSCWPFETESKSSLLRPTWFCFRSSFVPHLKSVLRSDLINGT